MSIRLVMVGMEHWFQQDVVPLQSVFQTKYGLQSRAIKTLQSPTGKEVCNALKFSKAPEMLIFYYSGHGSFENEHFKFCTRCTPASLSLSDHQLLQAIQSTGAQKVFIIIDACHAGGFAVKDDIEERLSRLACGHGVAVLGACAAASTTPGSSPLSSALKDVLSTNHDGTSLDPATLRSLVKERMSSVLLITGPTYQPFSLDHGLSIVASCRNASCTSKHHQFAMAVNYGEFCITSYDLPECQFCRCPLRAEALHFTNCTWHVQYGYQDGSRVVRKSAGPLSSKEVNHWSLDRSALEGYRFLDVSVEA